MKLEKKRQEGQKAVRKVGGQVDRGQKEGRVKRERKGGRKEKEGKGGKAGREGREGWKGRKERQRDTGTVEILKFIIKKSQNHSVSP